MFRARPEAGTKLTEMGRLQSQAQMVLGFSQQADRFRRTHVPMHVKVCSDESPYDGVLVYCGPLNLNEL